MAKILIIEDVADSAELARKILTKYGHEALIATNGEEALYKATELDIDLILLDLGLPDVDGQTLIGVLRRDYEVNVPIILCTAWPENAAYRMVKAYNFDDYISKPYLVMGFMNVVNRYV